MSDNIDERVVQLTLKNADFEKNANQSIQTLQNLQKQLEQKQNTKSLDELYEAFNKIDVKTLNEATTALSDQANVIKNVRYQLETFISENIFAPIKSSLTSLISLMKQTTALGQAGAGWSKYESVLTSTRTMMSATGESASEVEKYLDKLMWFTDETSYAYGAMADSMGKFTAKGNTMEQALSMVQGIALWAAQAGQDASTASRAMYQLTQVSGYVKLTDWQSIENANMATSAFMNTAIEKAKELGTLTKEGYTTTNNTLVTTDNFRSTLTDGAWLTSEVLRQTLEEYNEFANDVYEKAQETGKTATEIMSEIGDGYANATSKQAFEMAQVSKTFSDSVSATSDAVSTAMMSIYKSIFGGVEEAQDFFTEVTSSMYDVLAQPVVSLANALKSWKNGGWVTEAAEAAGMTEEAYRELNGTLGEFADLQEGMISIVHGVANVILMVYDALNVLLPELNSATISNFVKDFNAVATTFEKITGIADEVSDAISTTGNVTENTGEQVVETTEQVVEAAKSLDEIANEVIAGNYGNGQERIDQLTALGYSYEAVQNRVNELLGCDYRYEYETSKVDSATGKLITTVTKQADAVATVSANAEEVTESVDNVAESVLTLDNVIQKLQNGESVDDSVLKKFAEEADLSVREFKDLYQFGNNLQDILTAITSAVSILTDAIYEIYEGLAKPVIQDLATKTLPGIVSVISKIARKVTSFSNWFKSQNYVLKLSKAVYKILKQIGDYITYLMDCIDDLSKTTAFQEFAANINEIKDGLEKIVKNTLGKLFDKIIDIDKKVNETALGKITKGLTTVLEYALKGINKLWDLGKDVYDWFIKNVWTDLWQKIQTSFSQMSGFELHWPTSQEFTDFLSLACDKMKGISEYGNQIGGWLTNKLQPLFDAVSGASFTGMFSNFKIFESVPNIFSNVVKWFRREQSASETLDYSLASVGGTLPSTTSTITNLKNAGLDKVTEYAYSFSDAFDNVSTTLNNINIDDKLKDVGKYLTIFYVLKKSGDIVDGVVGLFKGIGTIAENVSGLIKNIGNIFGSISGVFTELKSVIHIDGLELSQYLQALKKSVLRKTMIGLLLSFAACIVVLTAAFYALSRLDWDQIARGSTGLGVIAIILVGVTGALTAMSKNMTNADVAGVAVYMLAFSISITIIVNAMKKIAKMEIGDLIKAGVVIGIIAAVLIGVFFAMKKISASYYSEMAGNNSPSLDFLQILTYVVALKLVASTISSLKAISVDQIVSLGITLVTLLGTVWAINTMLKGKKDEENTNNINFNTGVGIMAIAAGLWLWGVALEKIAGLDWDSIYGSLGSVILCVGSFIGVIWAISKVGKEVDKIGTGMLKMAAAVVVLSIGIKMLGNLSSSEITKAKRIIGSVVVLLITMSAAIAIIGKFSNIKDGSTYEGIGKTFTQLAAALLIVVISIAALAKIMTEYGGDTLALAIVSVIVILAALSVAMIAITKFGGSDKKSSATMIKASTFILGMATMIAAVAALIWILKDMDADTMKRVTIAVDSLVLVMAALVGAMGFGDIKASNATAGITAIIGTLVAIVLAIIALNYYVEDTDRLTAICDGLTEMVGVISILVGVIGAMAIVMSKNEINSGDFLGYAAVLTLAFDVIVALLTVLFEGIGAIDDALGGHGVDWVNTANDILKAVSKVFEDNGPLFSAVVVVEAIGVAMTKCGTTVGTVGKGAVDAGILTLAFDVIVALLTVLFEGIGAIDDALGGHGVDWVNTAGDIVYEVTNGLAKLVQGLTDGIASIIGSFGGTLVGSFEDAKLKYQADALKKNADTIAEFAEKTESFTSQMSTISTDNVSESIQKFTELIDSITALQSLLYENSNDSDDTNSDNTTAGATVKETTDDINTVSGYLDELGTALTTFSDSIDNIDEETYTKLGTVTDILDSIGTLVEGLNGGPNIAFANGLFAFTYNSNINWTAFSDGIGKVATGIADFTENAKSVQPLSDEVINTIDKVMNIGNSVDFKSGLWAKITSKNTDFKKYAEGLPILANGIASFIDALSLTTVTKGISLDGTTDTMASVVGSVRSWDSLSSIPENAVTNLQTIFDALNSLDIGQNTLSFLTECISVNPNGDTYDNFALALKGVGEGIKNFADATAGGDYDNLSGPLKALTTLGSFSDSLTTVLSTWNTTNLSDNYGSIVDWLGTAYNQLGEGINDLFGDKSVITVTSDQAVEKTKVITNFGTALKAALDNIPTTLSTSSETIYTSVDTILDTIVTKFDNRQSTMKESGKKLATEMCNGIAEANSDAKEAGKILGNNAIGGINNTDIRGEMTEAGKALGNAAVTGAGDQTIIDQMTNAGKYVAQGYANGISCDESIQAVQAAASNLATTAEASTMATQESNSPSKVFMRVGKYVSQGYANGIIADTSKVSNASLTMVNAALDALVDPMLYVSDVFADPNTIHPTITPVVDLSNIQNGSNQIQSMFGSGFSFATTANVAGSFIDPVVRNTQNMNEAVSDAINNADTNYSFDIPLTVDGRQIAKASAKYTQTELNKLTTISNRKGGIR